jgi:O-antigen ligase
VGYGFFTDNHVRTAHNSYILCFAELGLVGYFLWLSLLLVTILELYSLTKLPYEEEVDGELRIMGEALMLGMLTYLAASWFLSRTYAMTLYIVIGLAVALAEIARKEERPVASFSPFGLLTRVGFVEFASISIVVVMIKIYWA